VFGDDAGGNSEAEAGAAAFGGEMWQKELVLIFRGNAVPGVGNRYLNGIGFGAQMRGDGDLAAGRVFEGLGGVVDEIDDDAAEKWTIGADSGEILFEGGLKLNTIEAPGKDLDGFVDGRVGVGRQKFGGGETDELRERERKA